MAVVVGSATGAYYNEGFGGSGSYGSRGTERSRTKDGYSGNTYGDSGLFDIDGKDLHLQLGSIMPTITKQIIAC